MKIYSSSPQRIFVPPFLPWEKKSTYDLVLKTTGVFRPTHITTRLCLNIIDNFLEKSGSITSFLDVGCGCGVLGLFAAIKGVPFVVGVDISTRAVRLSRENARFNGLEHVTHWIAGSVSCLTKPFKAIVANLPVSVLLDLFEGMVKLLEAGGLMVISGFHDTEFAIIRDMARKEHLEIRELLTGDISSFCIPPSGSFTWMAVSMTLHKLPEK